MIVFIKIMDLLSLGSYTRLSCTLIKVNLLLAKLTISPNYPIYRIPYTPSGWTNWPINDVHDSNLNWRQFLLCHNIHVYFTSIIKIQMNYLNEQRFKTFSIFSLKSLLAIQPFHSIVKTLFIWQNYFIRSNLKTALTTYYWI